MERKVMYLYQLYQVLKSPGQRFTAYRSPGQCVKTSEKSVSVTFIPNQLCTNIFNIYKNTQIIHRCGVPILRIKPLDDGALLHIIHLLVIWCAVPIGWKPADMYWTGTTYTYFRFWALETFHLPGLQKLLAMFNVTVTWIKYSRFDHTGMPI